MTRNYKTYLMIMTASAALSACSNSHVPQNHTYGQPVSGTNHTGGYVYNPAAACGPQTCRASLQQLAHYAPQQPHYQPAAHYQAPASHAYDAQTAYQQQPQNYAQPQVYAQPQIHAQSHISVQGGGYHYAPPAPVYPQQYAYAQQSAYPQPQAHYAQNAFQGSHQDQIHGYYNPHRNYAPVYSQGNTYARGRGSYLSYESLNAFEAPVAAEILGITVEARGRLDSVTSYSLDQDNADPDHRFVGSHRITALKQLPNRYTLGAVFTGRAEDIGNGNEEYRGRIRGFVGGSWGTLIGGNVQDVVYENTRRLRGAGRNVGVSPRETTLAGDGALGRLSDWGGGYQGRFGPTTVSAIIDEDTNYDVGISFQRPIGKRDYRLTARHNTGAFLAADGLTEIDTKAVSGVGEYVYGSTRYDLGVGYEQLEAAAIDADRWFTSAGITTKRGVWSFTAEGLFGQTDGQNEASAYVGVKYDIARGLAATAGVDYQDRQITVGGVDIADTKDTRALLGLSYGF